MPMAGIGARSKIYTGDEVIAIPAALGVSTTIAGEVLYPFEQSGWGAAKIVYFTGDTADVGDTVVLKTYVSFDEGTNWDQVRTGDTVLNTTVDSQSFDIPFAPRVRIDIVSDSAGTLSAGHGVEVQIEFQENDPEAARIFYGDSIGDSAKVAGGDTVWAGTDGATITINSPNKITTFFTSDDLSDITTGATGFTWKLMSSLDGSHWFHGDTITAVPANGSGVAELASQEITTNLSKYARLNLTTASGDSAAGLGSDANIKYYFLAQE